jgi:hypothetical protein
MDMVVIKTEYFSTLSNAVFTSHKATLMGFNNEQCSALCMI